MSERTSRAPHSAVEPAVRPLLVGLTGGIASGKSTVARLFAEAGIPHVDADDVARDIVRPGSPALAELTALFGAGILDADGALDRARMRERVFSDSGARHQLEAIVHPRISAEAWRRLYALPSPVGLYVVPLLVEGRGRHRVDRIAVVDAPESVQVGRVMARDGSSERIARSILAAQAPRAARLEAADDVIANTGNIAALAAQVNELAAAYRRIAAARPGAQNVRLAE